MTQTIDVYRQWLKIEATNRPLDHYQLLKLKKFEDDVAKIREHYRKLNEHVRKFATGQYGPQSQQLLNELAKAMLCLTDSRRKAEYDAAQGRTSSAARHGTLEEILLARKAIDNAQLGKARNYANVVGVDMHDALIQQKLAPADVVMQAFAESVGVPYVDLKETAIDEFIVPKVPALLARQNSCVPVMIDDDQLLIAAPHLLSPEVEDELRLRIGITVRGVLSKPADIHEFVDRYYPKEAAEAEQRAAATASTPSAKGGSAVDTEERRKEREKEKKLLPLMFFNFGFMAIMLVLSNFFQGAPRLGKGDWSMFLGIATALLVGGASAGVGYLIAAKRA